MKLFATNSPLRKLKRTGILSVSGRDGFLPVATSQQFDQIGRHQVAQHLRHIGQFGFALAEADAVDESRQADGLLFSATVIASEQFGQFLMEMENGIGIAIFARHRIGPQFLHEEHLVSELWRDT